MIRKLQAVAIDCADPVRLAEFYAELLGGRVEVDAEDPDWVELRGFDGTPLAFQRWRATGRRSGPGRSRRSRCTSTSTSTTSRRTSGVS